MFNRMLRMALVCTAAAALAVGCGDDDENNKSNNTSNNATTNNSTSNNSTSNNSTTPTNVTTGNNNPDVQCASVGETCVIGDPTADRFVCEDVGDGPKCKQACQQPQTLDDPKGCTAGSVCVANQAGTATFCQTSQCTGWDDATSCDAFFPENGGNCFPDELFFDGDAAELLPNGAYFCAPSNGIALGETCSTLNDCAPGLLCDGGTCKALCGADGDCDEAGGERCIGDDTAQFLDNGVGLCDIGCDAFSRGQCPDGQGCFTVSETDGQCTDIGPGALGDQCQFGTEAMPAPPQCGEGLQCLNFGETDAQGNAFGRCTASCSTLGVNQAAWNSTCPTGDQDAFGRFVHLDDTKPAVDIYVNGALAIDDLAPGATSMNGMFAQVPVGQITVDIVAGTDADNSNPLLTVTPTTAANDAITWAITSDGAGIQVVSVDVPRNEAAPAAGSAKFRIGHGIPDVTPVDVVAVAANATDFTAESVLATNLAFGTAGAFVEAPAATYDVYVFAAGTARTIGAEAALFEDVALTADATFTVWASGAAANANLDLVIVDYVSANVSSVLPQFCFELADQPSPNGGFCFDTCTAEQYGQGVCGVDGFQCNPFARFETHLCFPGGDAAVGEACDPEVGNCDELGICEPRGDGSGVCVSHCQPGTQTNNAITCGQDQSCNPGANPASFNFGRCGTECTPTGGLTDSTCPANLQNCFVEDTDSTTYYCSASGSTAAGDACSVIEGGAFAPNTCAPGSLCANPVRLTGGEEMDEIDDPGVCTATCELVNDTASSCPAGTKCGLDWILAGTGLGFCGDTGANPDGDATQGTACTTEGSPCGDGTVCLDVGTGAQCLTWCDRAGGDDTCPTGTECLDIFQLGGQLDIGICFPPQ